MSKFLVIVTNNAGWDKPIVYRNVSGFESCEACKKYFEKSFYAPADENSFGFAVTVLAEDN